MVPLDSFSGGNDAQNFRFDSVGPSTTLSIDRLDNLLSKGILEPFWGVHVVEIDRRVVDHAVHIAVVNREHAQPFFARGPVYTSEAEGRHAQQKRRNAVSKNDLAFVRAVAFRLRRRALLELFSKVVGLLAWAL